MKCLHILTAMLALSIPFTVNAQTSSTTNGKQIVNRLNEVVVNRNTTVQRQMIENTQMGKTEIPVSALLKVPAIAGEADIIKALQLTPGVKKGTEGSIGMYVRGGSNDQNLILLDGAPIYNAGHLLGFFSVFNNATLNNVQLYKSSFPARYGGRLSSVLDVHTKEASLNDHHAQLNIGTISSSGCVQLPVIKDKISLMLAGRRTYIDKVMKNVPYHFHDINTKLFYKINTASRLYLSIYSGRDILKTNNLDRKNKEEDNRIQTGMNLGNNTASLRWNHMSASGKTVADFTVYHSAFRYNMSGKMTTNQVSVRSSIRDIGANADFKLSVFNKHKTGIGISIVNHYFNPNIVNSNGPLVERFGNTKGQKIWNNEAAVYINDEFALTNHWQVMTGVRFSGTATSHKTYINPEPRIGLRYKLTDNSAIKTSYARMVQYLHMVSGSSVALPTDLWYPVTANIKPGISDQVSAGYYYYLQDKNISFSAEVYYKWLRNLCEYKEGAMLMLNNNYEKELVTGKGNSYGLELMLSKTSGKLTGWLGYSLSYANRQFDSLNGGKKYFARYDRRHDLSLVLMYDISKSWSIGLTNTYATGTPFTGQTGQYIVPSPGFTGFEAMSAYTGRNELRMSASFRTDADIQYKFNITKRIKADAHLSIYNIFNRTQPYAVQRVWDESKETYKYQQKGLFGTITAASLNINI